MFNKKAKTHTIELQWKAQQWGNNQEEETQYKIIYEKIKDPNQDLKNFIKEERSKNAAISLDFIIDGTSLGLWLNLNYFTRKAIGEDYQNNITYGLNRSVEKVNFYYQRIILKRMLGQLITLEDGIESVSVYQPKLNRAELEERGKGLMEEENKDTMLYCSGCCGDRLCGYFGISIYQTPSHIVWYLNLGYIEEKISFEKNHYFDSFRAYINFINHQLSNLKTRVVSTLEEGEYRLDINTKMELLIKKHQINTPTFDIAKLIALFKDSSIEEINTGIYLGETLGFDIEQLEKEINDLYENLSETKKNGISWKIIDNSAYFSTLELYHPSLAKKAFLLFS